MLGAGWEGLHCVNDEKRWRKFLYSVAEEWKSIYIYIRNRDLCSKAKTYVYAKG